MSLSKQQVEHVAKLARLGLTEKEKEKFRKELSAILDFVEKLKEVDTAKIEPIAHITGLENAMREDCQMEVSDDQSEKLLKLTPKRKDGYVKVKAVL
jgi:aspartyl-tRNA(Asn)/glutamyl-tRNA(Gln) amidotransferase subunit C